VFSAEICLKGVHNEIHNIWSWQRAHFVFRLEPKGHSALWLSTGILIKMLCRRNPCIGSIWDSIED